MKRGSWKRVERRIAARMGGKRIPVTGRRGPDVAHPWLAIEVKSRGDMPGYLWDWLKQAELGGDGSKLPVVVLHRNGKHAADDLIAMRLGDFEEWFGDEDGA